ncbi:CHAT domain-containing protein [Moorena sp. SIO4G3]|uniref:CHAT domain-containing protein n=1 Tax=Moorena sp. SIO4G3 TaxID=2607821 RepID=UPI00142B4EDB|nr:CHAT domain-containing protein [Moorena sp. SIO4G3]NEO76954.1 tetratricopeptide repeat protein [Moorena sp. SIO4G3]
MPDNRYDTQLKFMLQVLQATADSNGDAQVVYPLLADNIDKLNEDLAELFRFVATNILAKTKPDKAENLAVDIVNFSNLISQLPLGDKASNRSIAITGYEVALTVFTREAFPYEWAMTQTNFGNAYLERITGDKAENLEYAIACYQLALDVCTREAFPYEWATTQNNLGSAYCKRITGDKAQNLEDAIACYQSALDVYTHEAFPEKWAGTQHNLGLAYYDRITGDKTQNLEDVIACFQLALAVYTREAFPDEWAGTQNNLGLAYSDRITGPKAQNLEDAIACYQLALEVRTRDAFPIDWAGTQHNLGNAYLERITGDKAQNLEQAIPCFQLALEVRTRQAFPVDWASTQNNLGSAYYYRIKGDKAQNLEDAIPCFQLALDVYTRQAFPEDWASTQNNLALAYYYRIKGDKAQNLEDAIACYQSALEVCTRQAFPEKWVLIQNNLGLAYSDRITGDKAQNLEDAIACYQSALEVCTRQAFREKWAGTQNNLGLAYYDRITEDKAQNLEDAIACYQLALDVYTHQAFPIDWAMTQNNLGLAYSNRITGDKAQNLEDAIACYQSALEVRTRQAFPYDWAGTQNNLGNAYFNRITGDKAQNLEVAIACYQSALEVRTREAFPYEWATTQNNLGNAYSYRITEDKAQNLEVAIACYQLALEVRTREAFPIDWAGTQNNLGITYQYAQNFPEAYKAFDAAIKTVESLRDEINSGSGVEEYKTKLAEKYNPSYRGMVEVCLELNNITEAIEYVERSKTQNLVDNILSRDLKTIFPPEVVTKLKQYRDEISVGQDHIQHGKAENPTALAQRLQELRQQRNDLQDQYLRIGSSFNFEQFRETIEENTAIVEFYITWNKLLTFIFTDQTQPPIVLQSEAQDLDKLVNWVNGYLVSYNNEKYDWKKNLSNRLHLLAEILHIDDIIQQIPPECDRLILIPHQVLHLFPLHALPINSQQGEATSEILMDRFPAGVSYAPSCQLLQLAQTRERPDFTHLFAVQNPTGDLSYANIEVEVIKGYFNPADTDVLVENASTKAAIESKPLNTFHCIHFSCHGYFNYENPKKPPKFALILADSQLTLDTIFALKLEQCRLVTLSACETGLIDFNNTSDEYIGLPSGFLVAGSPAVVSSLWRVEDLSTALLMIKFYQNLREPMSLAVALNQAQFWLRDATVQEFLDWAEQLTKQFNLDNNFKEKVEEEFCLYPETHNPFDNHYYWAAYCAIGQYYI